MPPLPRESITPSRSKYLVEDFVIPADRYPFKHARHYRLVYHDGSGTLWVIVAPMFRETATQYEPERQKRDILSENDRRALTKPLNSSPPASDGIGAAIETLIGPRPLRAFWGAFADEK